MQVGPEDVHVKGGEMIEPMSFKDVIELQGKGASNADIRSAANIVDYVRGLEAEIERLRKKAEDCYHPDCSLEKNGELAAENQRLRALTEWQATVISAVKDALDYYDDSGAYLILKNATEGKQT